MVIEKTSSTETDNQNMKEATKSRMELAWDFYNRGKSDEAINICKRLCTTKKYGLQANYLLAAIAFERKDFVAAIEYFERSIELDQKNIFGGRIYYGIGRTFEFTESWLGEDNPMYNISKADNAYKKALTYEHYPADAIFRLASRATDFEKLNLFERGIEKFPTDVDFYIQLANVNRKLGYSAKEINTLKKALDQNIQSSSLFFNLGNYYFDQDDFATSLEYYCKCDELNTETGVAVALISYCIGNCRFRLKDYVGAAGSYHRVFEEPVPDVGIWYNAMGLLLSYKRQRKKEAVSKLIKQLPNDKDLLLQLCFDYPLMSYLDGQRMEGITFKQDPRDLITILKMIQNDFDDSFSKFKIGLILSELYSVQGGKIDRLLSLRKLLPYPLGYDFIHNRISEVYSSVILSEEFNNQILDWLVEDISCGHLNPSTAATVIEELVEKIYNLKQYDKVVKVCELLTDEQLQEAKATFEYAYSLKTLGKWTEAKYYYELHLQKNPKSSAALNNLGVIYKEQGDFEKSISLFTDAIKHGSNESLYASNLKDAISEMDKRMFVEKKNKIPSTWTLSLKSLTVENLDEIEYFHISSRIERINKKYRYLVERDFRELTFNFLASNHKSTVILAGSLVEMVLTYYCEKKKIHVVQLKSSTGSTYNKKLYDCVLNDLIIYFNDKKLFGGDFHHLGNLARVYRNHIHPSQELKSKTDIRPKAHLCFISTIEILKKILPRDSN